MKVIGIDPSIASTGIACAYGELYTSRGPTADKDRRLVKLYEDLHNILTSAGANMAGHGVHAILEDLPQNAMGAGLTGRAQGVVRLVLEQRGIPWVTVVPSTAKKFATGVGSAKTTKVEMAAAFEALEGFVPMHGSKVDDNQVDAYFFRRMGLAKLGLIDVTPAQMESVNVVKWGGWGL